MIILHYLLSFYLKANGTRIPCDYPLQLFLENIGYNLYSELLHIGLLLERTLRWKQQVPVKCRLNTWRIEIFR